MVYVHHDPGIKQRALWLCDAGHSIEDVAAIMGVTPKSIHRWTDNYRTFGSVQRPAYRPGRPRAIDAAIELSIIEYFRIRPTAYLAEVKDYLAIAHDVSVSLSTLHSTLIRLGLSRKVALKPAMERDEELRCAWREEMVERFTSDQLVFGDETSVDMRNLRRKYGRSSMGFRAVQQYVQTRGQRWSLVSVIGMEGCLAARPVPGAVNSVEFFDFVVSEVVCQIENCFRCSCRTD